MKLTVSCRPWGHVASVILLVVFALSWLGGCDRRGDKGDERASARGGGPLVSSSEGTVESPSERNSPGDAAPNPPPERPGAGPASAPSSPAPDVSAATQPVSATGRIVAYYFHRTLRCQTCLSIEAQARAAIESGFADELSTGRMEWRAINIEEPGNEHFEPEYQLDRQALVLVETQDGQVQRHTKLERVWELVDDPTGFRDYVWTEATVFVGD